VDIGDHFVASPEIHSLTSCISLKTDRNAGLLISRQERGGMGDLPMPVIGNVERWHKFLQFSHRANELNMRSRFNACSPHCFTQGHISRFLDNSQFSPDLQLKVSAATAHGLVPIMVTELICALNEIGTDLRMSLRREIDAAFARWPKHARSTPNFPDTHAVWYVH
jgi:hypothetical protein